VSFCRGIPNSAKGGKREEEEGRRRGEEKREATRAGDGPVVPFSFKNRPGPSPARFIDHRKIKPCG